MLEVGKEMGLEAGGNAGTDGAEEARFLVDGLRWPSEVQVRQTWRERFGWEGRWDLPGVGDV